jgi:hypothetical protein
LNRERTALSFAGTFRQNTPPVASDDGADDEQTEAGPSHPDQIPPRNAVKAPENAFELVAGNAQSLVTHLHQDLPVVRRRQLNGNTYVLKRILYGVIEQVCDDRPEFLGIA